MADIVSLEDAARADALGFDYVSSTLRGYTEESKTAPIPDLDFLAEFVHSLKSARPVAEGGIRDIPTVRRLLGYGFETIIIGGAITRPLEITRHFRAGIHDGVRKGELYEKNSGERPFLRVFSIGRVRICRLPNFLSAALREVFRRAVLNADSRKKEPFFGAKGRIAGNRGEE